MKKWLKILLVIISFAAISLVLFMVLKALNITSISTLRRLVASAGKFGIIVYTLILIFALVTFCFVPLLNTSMIVLGIALFGAKMAFFSNIIAIFFSTTILFYMGDIWGEKLARRLIGKKSLKETQDLIDHKSKFWLPIFFIIPGIPDEALCLVAGMTKMKYWYLLLVSIIYHTFEIGIFCFAGSGIIDWSALSIIDWIIFINVLLIDIFFMIKLEKYLDKKIKK